MNEENFCTRCGKCCMNMRQYISATEKGGGRFACTCSLSREHFDATVQTESIPRMYDRTMMFRFPKACSFLVPDGERFTCLIHHHRPAHCRSFDCREKEKKGD